MNSGDTIFSNHFVIQDSWSEDWKISMPAKRAEDYFEFLAKLGLTKHYGSLDATRELAELTQIQPGQLVLDLGCGVGATPVYLAKESGFQIIGADLVESMLYRARERANKYQVLDNTAFLTADARVLPFPENCFDVVLLESVNVFFEDKLAAFKEYLRIIKPGGYIGITEMTWLKPPKEAYVELFSNVAFATAHQAGGWIELLKEAGFENVAGNGYPIKPTRESKGRFKRYGRGFVLKIIGRMLRLFLTDKKSRSFFQDGTSGLSKDIITYVGYGVFVGQKS
jgi:ubiquinone/menaquinone biosynthesis C-methylase UbiE